MSQPYTYRIQFIPTGEYYYGVRYSKTCHPSDLWIRYFTSCKKVKKLIAEYGKESFRYEVRRIFKTNEEAIAWEEKVTRRVIWWPNYINANSGRAFNHSKSVNGGIVAAKTGAGIHSMSSKEKAEAGRKGGLSLSQRKKESGLTHNEIEGHRTKATKISNRRRAGNWTEKELLAIADATSRKKQGKWTEAEEAAYAKVSARRRAGDWSDEELAGFSKVSDHRKKGKWITNGLENKFLTDGLLPNGWYYGLTRKRKGA